MKKLILFAFVASATLVFAKDKGDQCFADAECGATMECKNNVCVNKKEFDSGSMQAGKKCFSDSECIGAGKCEKNIHGQGVCTGN